jgi:hypothetical protein
VEDNQCQTYPSPVTAGPVTVEGLKANTGETSFSMKPIANHYMPPAGILLDFPPCAEGDTVTLTASGASAVPPFTLKARGISPLKILNDTITMLDGQSINLLWAPPVKRGFTTISVKMNISLEIGTKGIIECRDVPDDGALTIPASLLDRLKALGVAGGSYINIIRKSYTSNQTIKADLTIESTVIKYVKIPGLISCFMDYECPQGLTCNHFNYFCE